MEFVQHLRNLAKLVVVSYVAGKLMSCVSHTAFVHNTVPTTATLQLHTLPCLYVLKLVVLTEFV